MAQERSELAVAEQWLKELDAAIAQRDLDKVDVLFDDDGYWRDLLAFTWDIGWVHGHDKIKRTLSEALDKIAPSRFRLAEGRTAPRKVARLGFEVVEAFFEFETAYGSGIGVLRLVPDSNAPLGARAKTLLTGLRELKGYERRPGGVRIAGTGYDRSDTRRNWLDIRREQQAFHDRDPEVLIVGGGHSGVMLAAHLNQLGVDNLVIDRYSRIGDNWRTRYHSLALHNPTDVVYFPYMMYPPTFPQYLPKDKLANWFEAYVESMEINFWTSTEFIGARFDDELKTWTAKVRNADGTERTMRPRHVVIATGGEGGTPKIPDLPGMENFAGESVHSKHYTTGAKYTGKNVLVVGVATSAHDAALDLHNNGANVTMLQRKPTVVVDLESANAVFSYYWDGTPREEADLIAVNNFILPLMTPALREFTKKTNEWDREIIDGLQRAGMRLDDGEDGGGWLMKFFRYRGGYYINVGASEVIARGDIKILQADDMEAFEEDGLRMRDGSLREFHAVVFATGYGNVQEELRAFFGDEVAEKVGTVGGIDEGGEIRNLYRRTAQEGLWINTGGIPSARNYSPFLALQIRAALDGLIPAVAGDRALELRSSSAA